MNKGYLTFSLVVILALLPTCGNGDSQPAAARKSKKTEKAVKKAQPVTKKASKRGY